VVERCGDTVPVAGLVTVGSGIGVGVESSTFGAGGAPPQATSNPARIVSIQQDIAFTR
jgi:hypothetical protein